VKVSVIVPVFNPGEHVNTLVDSLLAQSLPAEVLELIFIDDGSTDGTAARLDALAAAHEHVRVTHIPNSGWPGRPRNVGLEMAVGDFVFFADDDDWLGRESLERMYATAIADDADIVLGKVVGHGGKFVPAGVFVENRHDLTASTVPFGLLSPHKLFRRALLDENRLRFPERHRALEDHLVVVPAFFKARRIAIVADYPCYHWVRREDQQNASLRRRDADDYYAAVAEVLDIVDVHTEPGAVRDRLYLRWYRNKLISRVGTGASLRRDAGERAQTYCAGRALMRTRLPPRLDAQLAYADRVRAALLRRGSRDGLEALARYDDSLRAAVRLRRVQGDGTWLTLTLTARLRCTEERDPPRFVRQQERLRFDAPEPLCDLLEAAELDATGALSDRRRAVLLRSLEDGVTWELPVEAHVQLVDGEDGSVEPRLSLRTRVAPTVAAGGAPLPPGEYEVQVVVAMAGFSARTTLKREGRPFTITVTQAHRLEHWGLQRPQPARPPATPEASLRRLVRRTPGAVTLVRRARSVRRALSAR
jgi:glycosyltransferase involved in cell wall biosynthesis